MSLFRVTYDETYSEDFDIIASSPEEAERIFNELMTDCSFGDYVSERVELTDTKVKADPEPYGVEAEGRRLSFAVNAKTSMWRWVNDNEND